MLRGQQPVAVPASSDPAAYPSGEQAYGCGDRSVGVRFYLAKETFFRPYALLRQMRLCNEQLTLGFPDEDVVVEGRGLHAVYVRLADQAVVWVCEQGERFERVAQDLVWIGRIQRVPRGDTAPA